MAASAVKKVQQLRLSDIYKPFPRQAAFHVSPARYRLFGGAAGPGKSKALLFEAIQQALEVPNSNTLLLRRTFPELEQSLLLYFRRDVPPQFYKKFDDSKHVVYWHNGSTTRFGYCLSESDVYQYQGSEYLFIGIDELTFFTLKMWQFLTSRNRCPVPGSFPCMAGATNPGNIGHAWVKALWIDKKPPKDMEEPEQYNPTEYDFIPARLEDNPVYSQDADYRGKLRALPKAMRMQLLEGDWGVKAGLYFDNFRTSHIRDANELSLKPWWPRWISMDWGFDHPASVYWHAQDGNRTITYRELHERAVPEAEWGKRIGRASISEKIQAFYLSPDAFAKRGSANTIAQQIAEEASKFGIPEPIEADNDRIGGARLMYQMLQSDLWVISSDCAHLIETIPTLVRDPKRIEDVLKMSGDDDYDAARYGLKSHLDPAATPQAVKDLEHAKTIDDPIARHFFMVKRQAERENESPIFQPVFMQPWEAEAYGE